MEKHIERINEALRVLNVTLREQTVDTGLVSIEQWNAEIAPKLMNVAMAIEGSTVTARVYTLPNDYLVRGSFIGH